MVGGEVPKYPLCNGKGDGNRTFSGLVEKIPDSDEEPLMLMAVMQFGKMRVIMGEGQVPMQVSVRFLKEDISVMGVVVMLFVPMDVVVF